MAKSVQELEKEVKELKTTVNGYKYTVEKRDERIKALENKLMQIANITNDVI